MIVSDKRVYGKIKNIGDLVEMQHKANEINLQAVGITDNGSMYVYDSIAEMAKQINAVKAKEILQLTDTELSEFIATRGEKDVSPVIPVEVETPSIDLPVEIHEDKVIEETEEVLLETASDDVATFQEEVVEDTSEAGEATEVQETQPVEETPESIPDIQVFHGPCIRCEDCSIYSDKIALAKSSINQKIEQLDTFKDYLLHLLDVLN